MAIGIREALEHNAGDLRCGQLCQDAAQYIAELEAALHTLFVCASDSSINPYCDEMKQARRALCLPALTETDE